MWKAKRELEEKKKWETFETKMKNKRLKKGTSEEKDSNIGAIILKW